MASEKDYTSMSYEDKLNIIDKELQDLHKYCVSEGLDRYTIERCAKPLLAMAKKPQRERFTKRMIILASIAVALFAMVYILPEYKLFWVFSRLFAIKMIPIFDWTDVINWDCLVDNPYFEAVPYNEDNCKICDGMDGIPRFRMADVSPDTIAEDYLKMNRPFVLTDATNGWPAMEKFSIQFIQELYTENPILNKVEVCNFKANFKTKSNEVKVHTVLEKLVKKNANGYTMMWTNCKDTAAKQLRPLYKRPASVPPMVEMSPTNMVMVANNYTQGQYRTVVLGDTMGMYSQVVGEASVKLIANEPCDETCPVLSTTLKPGETLIWAELMWVAKYSPNDVGQSIAICTGGTFDY